MLKRVKRRRLMLTVCLLGPAALLLGAYLTVRGVTRTSERFLGTGRSVLRTLGSLAEALQASDLTAVGEHYASGFRGSDLGLNTPRLAEEKDGIRIYRFEPGLSNGSPLEAPFQWRQYLESFDTIDQVEMHIHRLEMWDSQQEWVASIRYELQGKLKGAESRSVDRALFRFKFTPGPDRPSIREATLIEGLRAIGSPDPHFVNVARQAGIDFINQHYPSFLDRPLRFGMIRYGPAGISAVDYDSDGFYDLFIPDGARSRLFRNLGDGRFEDMTERAGLDGLDGVSVGIFADYDNDGHKDFFVSRTFSPNQLFRNNGDGTFSDVTERSGIGQDCCTTVASWADYDNDGDLDLYVGRYLDPRIEIPTTFYARNGEPNQLYRNNGDGTFSNVTEQAAVGETGLCLGTVFGDFDGDGFADLYVVNDFGRNTLYRNNGDGTFRDVSVEANALDYGAGMNASAGDYDNDGDLDLYVTNIRSEHTWFAEAPTVARYMVSSFTQGVWVTDMPLYWEILRQSGFQFVEVFQQMASGNTLLRNKGDGTFEDVTIAAGANPPGWFWGAAFADFDNDGWQDIYAANGWVYNQPGTEIELDFLSNVVSKQKEYKTGIFFDPQYFGDTSWHGWERNRMLRNNGDGTFVEVGASTGTDLIRNSRGIAVADFWNRGVLDIAVAASTDRHALLRNQVGKRRNWLALELVGTSSNRDAVGARAFLQAAGMKQSREVTLGDGYGSQNSLRLYFGLGQAEAAERITVRWPRSGIVQTFEKVPANQIFEITEGLDTLVLKHYGGGGRKEGAGQGTAAQRSGGGEE